MKRKFLIFLAGSLILFVSITLNSCRENFGFEEFDSLSNNIPLSGTVAIPLVNTQLTLEKYLPPNDSSLWAEIDATGLVHLKMYYEDLAVIKMSDVFDIPSGGLLQGTLMLKDSMSIQSDTSKMKVYNKMFNGHLFFNDPKVRFTIKNDIPLATFFRLDTLLFYTIGGELLSNNEHKEYPIDAPTIQGETINDTILIDKEEMPILPIAFSPVPKYIGFKLSAGSHTNQQLPFDVTGNEEMRVDAELDLPLDAKLDTILLADTIPFPWDQIDAYGEQIKEIELKGFFNNGFPVNAYIQLYYSDTTRIGEPGIKVDSAFSDSNDGWHMQAAATSSAGIANAPIESPFKIIINKEKLDYYKLNQVDKMIIVGKLNTYNSNTDNYIRIQGDNGIGIRMGLRVILEGNTNEF